jgi:hypothetical protein
VTNWVSPRELLISFDKSGGNPNHDQVGRFTSSGNGSSGQTGPLSSANPSSAGSDGDRSGAKRRFEQVIGNKQKSAEQAAALPPGKLFVGGHAMGDDEYSLQRQHVEHELTAHGASDMAHSASSTHITQDSVGGVIGHYNDSRRVQQNQIMAEYEQKGESVPNERRSIIMGGLGGAGKSSSISANAAAPDSVASHLGIKFASYDDKGNGVGEPTNFLILNPDDIKERMAAMGMVPKIDHLSPMEASPFVHEEASQLTKDIAAQAIAQGKNVIWDITLHSTKAGDQKMEALRREGYHVAGAFVDVSVQQSLKNAGERHRRGQDKFNQGIGNGGRFVPSNLITGAADKTGRYRSENRAAFEDLKAAGKFDSTVTVDNENYVRKVLSATGSDAPGQKPLYVAPPSPAPVYPLYAPHSGAQMVTPDYFAGPHPGKISA